MKGDLRGNSVPAQEGTLLQLVVCGRVERADASIKKNNTFAPATQ